MIRTMPVLNRWVEADHLAFQSLLAFNIELSGQANF
jgi:hypothetical protein